MENKIKELANILVNHSIKVGENEKVLVVYQDSNCLDLVKEVAEEIYQRKAFCTCELDDNRLKTIRMNHLNSFTINAFRELEEAKMDFYDSIIYIKYNDNDYELSNIADNLKTELLKSLSKAQDIRVNERKWVLLNYPSLLDAYKAKMSYQDFKEYAFEAMTVDYYQMEEDLKPLKELMDKTNNVRIVGSDTDISFSIEGMKSIICAGVMNIPDGEVYTAPLSDSVNGKITYNTMSPYNGKVFHNVSLTFKDGKIIDADSLEGKDELNKIFDQDEGARYVGEFSLGVNKNVLHPMGDILYDEKIYGSLHFTPGASYQDAFNGNKSVVHWDLVLIQREDYGGGEIYFDDVLIRKDGKFTLDSLKALNK